MMASLGGKVIAGLIAAVVLSGHAAAGPIIFSAWKVSTLSLDECKDHAAVTLRHFGFQDVQKLESSVFAERAQYSATIRCATDIKAVFIVVAGPDSDVCSQFTGLLNDNF